MPNWVAYAACGPYTLARGMCSLEPQIDAEAGEMPDAHAAVLPTVCAAILHKKERTGAIFVITPIRSIRS